MDWVGHCAAAPDERLREAEALFFIDDLAEPILSQDDYHHLAEVLRLRVGERIAFADGRGSWRLATIAKLASPTRRGRHSPTGEGQRLEFEVSSPIESTERALPELTVAFAMPKGDRIDLIVQKLTEIGIDNVIPLMSARTVMRLSPAEGAKRTERLERVARAAAAQSRRLFLPVITAPCSLSSFLELAPTNTVFAEPGGPKLDRLTECVIVGPEGGFLPEELSEKFGRVGLGPTILRAETAAIGVGVLLASLRAGVI
jgi:16S rRNA (uracil1498-N3)-methyltransferase